MGAALAYAQTPEVIQQRLELVSRNLDQRRTTLESLFRQVGCATTEESVPHSREPNILCALDPENAGTIVVGGHFDFVDRGTGAVDDWSGVALLPSLYQSLKDRPLRHRFLFIAFAGEEEGLFGSKQYVRALSKEEKTGTRAMINLECLGLTTPKVWRSRANPKLFAAYVQAAAAAHIPAEVMDVDKLGDDDSHPFLNAGIPVLTIHSVTDANAGLLHSAGDNLKAINPRDYYDAYRLAATYLAYLDSKLE
ncbi:MAG: M28 family peptidase [Candidatus Sulfopaludibacter sp.]|nr:M28 family peptidase [Candidatus Sulfopaludibacter sp.]